MMMERDVHDGERERETAEAEREDGDTAAAAAAAAADDDDDDGPRLCLCTYLPVGPAGRAKSMCIVVPPASAAAWPLHGVEGHNQEGMAYG